MLLAVRDLWLRRGLLAVVVAHAIVAAWHGASHMEIPVALSPLQIAYVAVVITLLPLLGTALLWTRRVQTGAAVLALSMLGSLIFGVVNHYVLDSPDNVASLPDHVARHAFVLSAALLAVTESAGTLLGVAAFFLWRGGALSSPESAA